VIVWETGTWKEIAYGKQWSGVKSVAFGPDGSWLVSGNGAGGMIWKADSGEEIGEIGSTGAVITSPDRNYLVSACEGTTVCVWEAATRRVVARFDHEVFVPAIAFSWDGKRVVSGSGDGVLNVWLWQR
jgi:WD40 repeat protein